MLINFKYKKRFQIKIIIDFIFVTFLTLLPGSRIQCASISNKQSTDCWLSGASNPGPDALYSDALITDPPSGDVLNKKRLTFIHIPLRRTSLLFTFKYWWYGKTRNIIDGVSFRCNVQAGVNCYADSVKVGWNRATILEFTRRMPYYYATAGVKNRLTSLNEQSLMVF